MKVKVCGMRDKSNISAMVNIAPDYMGFIFYTGSSRFAAKQLAPESVRNLPGSVKRVGVFVNSTPDYVSRISAAYNLDYIQLHGGESPEYCRGLQEQGAGIIKAFRVDEAFDFQTTSAYKPFCDFFLFDTKGKAYGGTGKCFNWDLLRQYDNEVPFFLSGGISMNEANIIPQLTHLNIHAVDINSRFEIEPGLKDVEKVKSFTNIVRHEI